LAMKMTMKENKINFIFETKFQVQSRGNSFHKLIKICFRWTRLLLDIEIIILITAHDEGWSKQNLPTFRRPGRKKYATKILNWMLYFVVLCYLLRARFETLFKKPSILFCIWLGILKCIFYNYKIKIWPNLKFSSVSRLALFGSFFTGPKKLGLNKKFFLFYRFDELNWNIPW
jgi:hypothetical protein